MIVDEGRLRTARLLLECLRASARGESLTLRDDGSGEISCAEYLVGSGLFVPGWSAAHESNHGWYYRLTKEGRQRAEAMIRVAMTGDL